MAYIKALTYYLPEKVVSNEELQELLPDTDVAKTAKAIGVEVRHISASDETAADLAVKAGEKLFKEKGVNREDIDFVIFCTQFPDYPSPSTACILQDRLNIPTTAGAVGIDLGCSGFVYGLMLADGLVANGAAKNVLLLTGDTPCKCLYPTDVNRILFGEAATACVVSTEGYARIGKFDMGTDGSGAEHLIIKTGGMRNPKPTGKVTIDEDGHVHSDDYIFMDGNAIFDFSIDCVPPMIDNILEKNQLTKDDVDYYVFHQANRFMLNTIRKLTKLPKEKFHVDLTQTGNTSCNTVPIGLVQAMESGSITKGSIVMITGFGIGLSWAGTILTF